MKRLKHNLFKIQGNFTLWRVYLIFFFFRHTHMISENPGPWKWKGTPVPGP